MAMIQPEDRHEDYSRLSKISDSAGETNDCAVVATCIAYDLDYDRVHKAFKKSGRKNRCGSHWWTIHDALDSFGRIAKNRSLSYNEKEELRKRIGVKTLTFNNVVRGLRKDCRYILIGRAHMVAVKEGRIADWSEGTKRQIEQIFEISHSVPRKAYNSKEAS